MISKKAAVHFTPNVNNRFLEEILREYTERK